eukprot:9501404-Pyramimonas_sp.AAC.2
MSVSPKSWGKSIRPPSTSALQVIASGTWHKIETDEISGNRQTCSNGRFHSTILASRLAASKPKRKPEYTSSLSSSLRDMHWRKSLLRLVKIADEGAAWSSDSLAQGARGYTRFEVLCMSSALVARTSCSTQRRLLHSAMSGIWFPPFSNKLRNRLAMCSVVCATNVQRT